MGIKPVTISLSSFNTQKSILSYKSDRIYLSQPISVLNFTVYSPNGLYNLVYRLRHSIANMGHRILSPTLQQQKAKLALYNNSKNWLRGNSIADTESKIDLSLSYSACDLNCVNKGTMDGSFQFITVRTVYCHQFSREEASAARFGFPVFRRGNRRRAF